MRMVLLALVMASVLPGETLSGLIAKGNELRGLGDLDGAERVYNEALQIADNPIRPRLLNNLASLFYERGVYERAIELYTETLKAFDALPQKELGPVAIATANLGECYRQQDQFEKAEAAFRRSLELRKAAFGEEHPGIANPLVQLANLRLDTARGAEAEVLALQALAIREKSRQPEDSVLGTIHHALGQSYRLQAKYDLAERSMEKALAIRTRLNGVDHAETAFSRVSLAAVLIETGRLDEAQTHLDRALAVRKRLYGPNHPQVAACMNSLAILAMRRKDYATAREQAQEAVRIWDASPGASRLYLAAGLTNLGQLQLLCGNLAAAEPLLRRAIAIFEKIAPDHPQRADALSQLSDLFVAQGKLRGAEKLLGQVMAIRKGSGSKSDEDAARMALASVYRLQRRFVEANRLVK